MWMNPSFSIVYMGTILFVICNVAALVKALKRREPGPFLVIQDTVIMIPLMLAAF